MATVPIEIVLQDAEVPVDPTPTPTPESGEETNIVVPNTGTISNDGSNSGGTGSSISIILPIVIAVLALGAMVALLVRRQQKRKKVNDGTEECSAKVSKKITSRKEKLATVASGTIAILAATVLVGNLVVPATKAATSIAPGTAELETEDKITIIATREQDSDTITATVKNTSYATANLDFGYKVTASMAEGVTTANLYLDGDETSEHYIAPVEDGILADNSWGYTLEEPSEDAAYLSTPLEDIPTTIVKGSGEIEDEPVDIYYTIRVDKSLPTGTYSGELEYTLTDNNFPSTLTTMQGMTTKICEDTFTPGNQVTDPVPTATLEDTRDHKTYTIAKLADGNCWMTQNLDLDLSTETALTPVDTDVSADWTPERKTIESDDLAYGVWMNDAFHPYSYDPGNIYYYTSGSDTDDIQYDSLAECEAVHNDGTCQHYHAGNYYNWSAAVASNDTSGMTEQYSKATNSICPNGWRLPVGNNPEDTFYEEMVSLIGLYGEVEFQLDTHKYNYTQGGFKAIRTAPFWLNRSGQVVYGSLSQPAGMGAYWANSIGGESKNDVALLRFSSVGEGIWVKSGSREYGLSVRCTAK